MSESFSDTKEKEDFPHDSDESMEYSHDYDYELVPSENIPEFGHPVIDFDDDAKPKDIIEGIMDDIFIFCCIETTNEHGANDPKFMEKIGLIPQDEKGVWFLWFVWFFAMQWHF